MKKFRINLTATEREDLLALVKKGKRKAQHIQYAHILLCSDESNGNTVLTAEMIAGRYHVSVKTVERVRCHFCEMGMLLFENSPRSTRSDKKFDARVEAHLLALVCHQPPEETPRWTLQLLADNLVRLEVVDSISKSSVCNLLKKTNLSLFKKNNI